MIVPISQIIKNLEERAETMSSAILTGFPKLDKQYLGIGSDEIWVIGAYTGSGKTFFLLQLALNIVRSGKSVLYFSLEMGKESLVARLLGNVANILPKRLQYDNLTLEEHQQRQEATSVLSGFDGSLFFDDTSYSLKEIFTSIHEVKKIRNIDLVILDYIQNVQGAGDEYSRLSEAIGSLQKFAKETHTPFFIASQISNEERKMGSDSKVIGLKGTGNLAASPDMVLWLENLSDYEPAPVKYLELKVRKSRGDRLIKFKLQHLYPSGRIEQKPDIVKDDI